MVATTRPVVSNLTSPESVAKGCTGIDALQGGASISIVNAFLQILAGVFCLVALSVAADAIHLAIKISTLTGVTVWWKRGGCDVEIRSSEGDDGK